MIYHKLREDALTAGKKYEEHFELRAELEAYNGWVLILSPRSLSVFAYPLLGLLDEAEIDLAAFPRLKRPDPNKVRPAALEKPAASRRASAPLPPPPPPPGGSALISRPAAAPPPPPPPPPISS